MFGSFPKPQDAVDGVKGPRRRSGRVKLDLLKLLLPMIVPSMAEKGNSRSATGIAQGRGSEATDRLSLRGVCDSAAMAQSAASRADQRAAPGECRTAIDKAPQQELLRALKEQVRGSRGLSG